MSSGTVTQPPAAWKTGPEGSGTRGAGGGGAADRNPQAGHVRSSSRSAYVPATRAWYRATVSSQSDHECSVFSILNMSKLGHKQVE